MSSPGEEKVSFIISFNNEKIIEIIKGPKENTKEIELFMRKFVTMEGRGTPPKGPCNPRISSFETCPLKVPKTGFPFFIKLGGGGLICREYIASLYYRLHENSIYFLKAGYGR